MDAYRKAGLTRQQRSLLEGILRSLEHGAALSDHVSALRSACLAVTRAQEALSGNVTGQPGLSLTKAIVTTSLVVVTAAKPAFSLGGAADLEAARLVLHDAGTNLTKHTPAQMKTTWADQLRGLAKRIAAEVRAWVATVWEGPPLPAAVLTQVREELTVEVALAGRDGRALREDLIRLLGAGCPDAATLSAILWPVPRIYRVTLLVEGTQQLEHLDQLVPGARQWSVTGDSGIRDSDSKHPRVLNTQELVASANRARRSATAVEIPVSSADPYTAIQVGRRQVSEALDQYAATLRLVDFSIGPRSVVTDPGNVRLLGDPLVASVRSARPLMTYWPPTLRPALRSAHLASQANAPMTSAALAWSAIDSMGLESRDMGLLAKACALHTLRQQVISLYRAVTESGVAHLTHAQWQAREANRVLGKAERAAHRMGRQTSEAGRARHQVLIEAAELKRARSQACATHLAQAEASTAPLFAALQHGLFIRDLTGEPVNLSSRLLDFGRWMDALLPQKPDTSPDRLRTHAAVDNLGAIAGGLAADALEVWRARLAQPTELARWLDNQEGVYHSLLAWLYATRNLAFHSGQFTGPADTLTAHAARGMVDMALEFLGNWQQAQEQQGERGTDAADIVRTLAIRKDELAKRLINASSCRPLNVELITSMDSDGWDRR